jgi:ATP-binding cassette, subfamily B (MDR/TAP), member 1
MWPFALLALATLPLMMFAVSQRIKTQLGADQGVYLADELHSPGGIMVETLLNIRTVSALTLEQQRLGDFKDASRALDKGHRMRGFTDGLSTALGLFVRNWISALQLWFGGYLIFTFPNQYSFQDFLISNFAIMFSLFGLATAFQDMADQKAMRESAGRIFALLDRQSAIDPLSSEGKVL